MKPLSILFYFLCFPAFMYSQNEPFLNVTLRVQEHTPLMEIRNTTADTIQLFSKLKKKAKKQVLISWALGKRENTILKRYCIAAMSALRIIFI